jgi:ribosome-associated toxin RatA of RatAB toxin-antitoxin module
MQTINRSALVPFGADQMFRLVDDIAAYPQFLPWCKSSNEIERRENGVKASIEISKAGLHKTFTTDNINLKNECIEMKLVEGPFKHLQGFWRFQQFDDKACKVSLNIEFEFASKILDKTMGPIFGQICNTLVEAFVKRAQDLYGRRNA